MVIHDRYHRQRIVEGFGDDGQLAIKQATVAIVGLGALGCLSASMLARAGIGNLILIDRDVVEKTNLQRQLLFTEEDASLNLPKAVAAKQALCQINSEINICCHIEDLNTANAERILDGSTILVDGLDNFQAKYLLNDYAIKHKIPYMFAGVIAGHGNVMTVLPEPKPSPCLRCMFSIESLSTAQNTCEASGVLSPAVGIAASCQAMDVLKYATGNRNKISNTLLTFDLWNSISKRIPYGKPITDCPCCSEQKFEFLNCPDTEQPIALCGQDTVQIPPSSKLNLSDVEHKLNEYGTCFRCDFLVRSTLNEEIGEQGNPIELLCFKNGRILVHGTQDIGRAKAIYARYVEN